MTKRLLLISAFLLVGGVSLLAQNLQLHFDPRRTLQGKEEFPRNYATATFEMFKPDKWGSTFMFVDLDFSMSKGNIGSAYMEIARSQNLGKLPIKAHVEFNGGIASWGTIHNAYLLGAAYPFAVGKFNFNTYIAYKLYTFDKTSHDVQWTFTWGANFFNDKLTICGFMDLWSQNEVKTKDGWKSGKEVVFLTEPQFWYNITSNLSVGTEIEISSNFYGKDKAYVNPTIAAKWNF